MKQQVSTPVMAAILAVVVLALAAVGWKMFGPGSAQNTINKELDAKHAGQSPMMQRNDPAAMQQYRQRAMQMQQQRGGMGRPGGMPPGGMPPGPR